MDVRFRDVLAFAVAQWRHRPGPLALAGGLMLLHWPLMGLLFLAGAVAYSWVSVRLALGYVAPRRRVAADSDSRLGGSLADAITCNAVVKSTAAESREEARLAAVLDRWQALMLRAWYASIHTAVAQNAMLIVLQAALVGGAVALWSAGRATPGDVTYVLTSFLLVGRWLRDVGMQLRNAQQAANDMERLVEYHRTDPAIADRPDAVPLAVAGGAIRFAGVRFHYPLAMLRPCSTASRSTSGRVSGWRSSATPAAARPASRSCCSGCTRLSAGGS
jgi:ATP-binding cassette subfamily B protein